MLAEQLGGEENAEQLGDSDGDKVRYHVAASSLATVKHNQSLRQG